MRNDADVFLLSFGCTRALDPTLVGFNLALILTPEFGSYSISSSSDSSTDPIILAFFHGPVAQHEAFASIHRAVATDFTTAIFTLIVRASVILLVLVLVGIFFVVVAVIRRTGSNVNGVTTSLLRLGWGFGFPSREILNTYLKRPDMGHLVSIYMHHDHACESR